MEGPHESATWPRRDSRADAAGLEGACASGPRVFSSHARARIVVRACARMVDLSPLEPGAPRRPDEAPAGLSLQRPARVGPDRRPHDRVPADDAELAWRGAQRTPVLLRIVCPSWLRGSRLVPGSGR